MQQNSVEGGLKQRTNRSRKLSSANASKKKRTRGGRGEMQSSSAVAARMFIAVLCGRW